MKNTSEVNKIFDVVLAFKTTLRYEDLLNTILHKMIDLTSSDAGTLYILEENKLHFTIIRNKTLGIYQSADDTIDLPPVILDETNITNVSAYAAIKNEPVVIDDVYESGHFNFSGPKNYDKITGYRSRSMLVLPMSTFRNGKQEVLGVIQLMNATDANTGEFVTYGSIEEQSIVSALANIAANTLSNLIHIREIRELFRSFVLAMVRTIDERSKYNSNHTHKVAVLCSAFAKYLSSLFPEGHPYHFDGQRLEELTMAAMLHDIGKIVTPLNIMDKADRLGERLPLILNNFEINLLMLENEYLKGSITETDYTSAKTGLEEARTLVEKANSTGFLTDDTVAEVKKLAALTFINTKGKTVHLLEEGDVTALSVRKGTLTEAELTVMREHVNTTGRILTGIAFQKYYENVTHWAESHHELLDGSGYPQGLQGDELATEVLIITIMDIFEALTANDRPYKKGMPVEVALKILHEMADEGKLHGELVQLFAQSHVWDEVLV